MIVSLNKYVVNQFDISFTKKSVKKEKKNNPTKIILFFTPAHFRQSQFKRKF